MTNLLDMQVMYALLIIFWGVGDTITTYLFCEKGAKDGNPCVKFLTRRFGFGSFIIGKILSIMFVWNFTKNNPEVFPIVLILPVSMGISATILNTIGGLQESRKNSELRE